MFDWNDEELTNIIWGGADESGDHIVPYPEENEGYSEKKAWNQENDNVKSIELKAPGAKVNINERKLESCSNVNLGEGTSESGFSLDLWPNLSLASDANTKHDSLDNSVSSNLTDITKFASSRESVQLSKDAESKEQGDFVDYGWASIGSFDDLDRIFSNDDQIFGNVNHGNADELWPSSKDVGSRAEYMQEGDQLFRLGTEKMDHPASHVVQNAHPIMNRVEFAGSKSNPVVKKEQTETILEKSTVCSSQLTADNLAVQKGLEDKVNKPKKLLRGRKKQGEKNAVKFYPDPYGSWSSYGSQAVQFAAPALQSSPAHFVSQPKHLIGHGQFQNQPISNPLMAASAYGSVTKPYSAMPMLSRIQSGQLKDQQLSSSGDENTLNKLAPSPAKSQTMTPQEKIEKLRRRQQIQAMLAIQKQQQQFGHQVSSSDQSLTHKCSQANQIRQFERADQGAEVLSNFPSFNPNSPVEQDSSTTSLAVNDYPAEDTIVYLLQDIIAKLDARTRLCIRDSLFRLAQSAMQRHTATDTSRMSNSRDEQLIATNESRNHNGNAKVTEVEAETNPIDRAVAHLLFYRSPELSRRHPDTPESPASSTKLLCEHKTGITENLSLMCVPESPESKQTFACSLVDQCKNNFYLDNMEDASNNRPPGEDNMEVEASQ